MDLLLIVLGALLVGFMLLDALWTTLALYAAGPLTRRLARGWWRVSLRIHRRVGTHELLALAGPALLVTAFLVWVGGLWAGWLLIFSADPGAVHDASADAPADFAGRVYYVGFLISTLGTGDYVPIGDAWQVLSAVVALCGLFVVSLAITYVLSVASAVTAKRQLAGTIHGLGDTPADIVRRAWDGEGFPGLEQPLHLLASNLEHHTQRHLAYPILHYYHSGDRRTALEPAVGVLDDALRLLAEGVAPAVRPAPIVLEPARRAVAGFLDTLDHSFIDPAPDAPPPPTLAPLAAVGIPTTDEAAFVASAREDAHRRRLLLGLVHDSGWGWSDVTGREAYEEVEKNVGAG